MPQQRAKSFKNTKEVALYGLDLQGLLARFPEQIIMPTVKQTGKVASRRTQRRTIEVQKNTFWPIPRNTKHLSLLQMKVLTPRGDWHPLPADQGPHKYLFAFYLNWFDRSIGLQKVLADSQKKVIEQKGIPVAARPKSIRYPVFGHKKIAIKKAFVIKKGKKKILVYRINKEKYKSPVYHDLEIFFTLNRINIMRNRFFKEYDREFDKILQRRLKSAIKKNQKGIARLTFF